MYLSRHGCLRRLNERMNIINKSLIELKVGGTESINTNRILNDLIAGYEAQRDISFHEIDYELSVDIIYQLPRFILINSALKNSFKPERITTNKW